MKLFPLLFENPTSTNNLALAIYKDNEFILYDVLKLRTLPKTALVPDLSSIIAAWTEVGDPETDKGSNCLNAVHVSYQVRSPNYPGAGRLLVKLISSVLGAPITSDRKLSNTPEAQKMWKNIEASGDMQKLTLDNFFMWDLDGTDKKQYFTTDDQGNVEPGLPLTPKNLADDCLAPGSDPNTVKRYVGAAVNAFQSNMDTSSFENNHIEALDYVEKELDWNREDFVKKLAKSGTKMFLDIAS